MIEVSLEETLRQVSLALETTYGREKGLKIFIRLLMKLNQIEVKAAVNEIAKTMPTSS